MSKELTRKVEFRPLDVDRYKELLSDTLTSNNNGLAPGPFRSQIAYSLQYLEFLDNIISRKNHNVIDQQLKKTFIIVGCSIIEAIFRYVILASDKAPRLTQTNKWQLKVDSKDLPESAKIMLTLVRDNPDGAIDKNVMTFDWMTTYVEKKRLLPGANNIFKDLNHLRKLRNSVHIHNVTGFMETDFHKFGSERTFQIIKRTLYNTLTCDYFSRNERYRDTLSFIDVNVSEEAKGHDHLVLDIADVEAKGSDLK